MSRTAIITGAGGAIAAAVTRVFKQAGWQLALFVYSEDSLKELQRQYPDSLLRQVDLGDETATQQAVDSAIAHFGKLDALLNIAGGFAMNTAEDSSAKELEQQLNINLRTLVNASQAVLPQMLKQNSGFILGVGAAPAIRGGAKMSAYAASKAAAMAYLKSLGLELAPKGIGVSVIIPMGTVDTKGNRASMPKSNPQMWIEPQDLAQSMLHLASRGPRGRIPELKVYPPQ